jgi:phosphatidylglycerophosphate synthase
VHAVQTPVLPTVAQGPANQVTLTRALLSLAVALMVAVAPAVAVPVSLLVGTTVLALALDWVDGQVARRSGTVTEFGARFDMEVDAFLILVLSVYVARSFGPWVLAIGLARYALLAAEQVWPWLRRRVPARYWRKVVAAIQGVVLTTAASTVLPHYLAAVALVGALLLLAESFGRDVLYLSRSRLATR